MKRVMMIVATVLLTAGCTASNGGKPTGEFDVFDVTLSDGRVIECLSSDTYGGNGVLDCNWNPR